MHVDIFFPPLLQHQAPGQVSVCQLSCILDSCTISASYEVSQAQKAILLMPRTAKGASTSSEELNAQISPRTDEEHNLPAHEDYWQEY